MLLSANYGRAVLGDTDGHTQFAVEWKHLSPVWRKGLESSVSPGNGWGLSPINMAGDGGHCTVMPWVITTFPATLGADLGAGENPELLLILEDGHFQLQSSLLPSASWSNSVYDLRTGMGVVPWKGSCCCSLALLSRPASGFMTFTDFLGNKCLTFAMNSSDLAEKFPNAM